MKMPPRRQVLQIRALVSSTDYERSVSACCPCFETFASLAPQHEVVVFQQVRPHPEEATKWPSRRMGCSSPAPPVLPDFFADQAGDARLLLGHRNDPALGRPACDLEQQLGPDRFLELFAILDRHHERARTA